MKSAVLVIGFNRPDLLAELLPLIPKDGRKVFIAIDGARNTKEEVQVEQCISVVQEFIRISKDVSIATRFAEHNQGCKYGVSNAIEWAFSTEESLIILEDDIRPTPLFFKFCDFGLEHFQKDLDIWQLNGWTPLDEKERDVNFYQTIHAHIWGWATWKDRWNKFDLELESYKGKNLSSMNFLSTKKLHKNFDIFWERNLYGCASGKVDTWDTQWLFSMWHNSGAAVSPTKRLCGNVGFDERATHTHESGGDIFSKLPDDELFLDNRNIRNLDKSFNFDLIHDSICYKLDEYNQKQITLSGIKKRLKSSYFRKVLRKINFLKVK